MFFDVLGRKDKADKTRNALLVLNRFKFLFQLPANIRAHLAKEDYDRVSEEYERARALYGNSEEPLFQTYLAEAEKGVQQMKVNIFVTRPNIFRSYYICLIPGDAVCQIAGGPAECGAAEEADRIPDPVGGRGEL